MYQLFDHLLSLSSQTLFRLDRFQQPFSDDKSHYVQIVYSYFDQIKEDDMPALAELLIGICLQHEYIDERTIRLTIELSKKLPSASYVIELVDNNVRRPKKSKAY